MSAPKYCLNCTHPADEAVPRMGDDRELALWNAGFAEATRQNAESPAPQPEPPAPSLADAHAEQKPSDLNTMRAVSADLIEGGWDWGTDAWRQIGYDMAFLLKVYDDAEAERERHAEDARIARIVRKHASDRGGDGISSRWALQLAATPDAYAAHFSWDDAYVAAALTQTDERKAETK